MGISVASLTEHLDRIERIPDERWMESLDDRKLKELEFHDMHRDLKQKKSHDADTFEKLYGNEKYYQTRTYAILLENTCPAIQTTGKAYFRG